MNFNQSLLALLFLTHLGFVAYMCVLFARFHQETLDTLSKIAQQGMIFQKSKNAKEAVETIAILKNESSVEEELQESKGRPMGFKDQAGRFIRFMTPPDEKVLSRISKERLVYQ